MKNTKVTPSSQVDSFLPSFVNQQYTDFVNFMQKSAESQERVGFGQDILQNLQKYRDFDTYADKIVQYGYLNEQLTADADELTLVDTYGFPEENGVLLIDDEVILYRTKEGNTLYGLQRGASATTVLPTLRSDGTYKKTVAAAHERGSQVQNLSVLFLVAILGNIHDSFSPNIEWERVNENINRSSLLQNIKDFFSSKGSNVGITSLFKILFGRTNVSVEYPGDKMLRPSESTWTDTPILRVIPFPEILSDPSLPYTTPEKLIGSEICVKSYNDTKIHGRGVCDYVSVYPFESETQYELYINEDSISGDFPLNPATTLTRVLERSGTNNDNIDVTTITVESTLGFPAAGIIFIDNEGIRYTSKTQNQFLGCTRGHINTETQHANGSTVYGPYYLSGTITVDGVDLTSYSWPLNLVKRVNIKDPGSLVLGGTAINMNGPGMEDPGNQILESLVENLDDDLMTQANTLPNMAYNGQYSDGIDSVYFNDDRVLVSTSSFPAYQIGPFSTDDSVGPDMTGINGLYQIPQKKKENTENFGKASGPIGVAVDGVPFYSNESPDFITSGAITKINVEATGASYVNPTVIIDGAATATANLTINGAVESVTIDSNDDYYSVPNARISSGEGESFSITFDNYGRLTSVSLLSGGLYYNDQPAMVLVDSSGRGRGALITCEVSGGSIQSVTIVSPGIDYNAATTELRAIPVGAGAALSVEVERFIFDRPGQVANNAALSFDAGNGFLYEDAEGARSRFGYVGVPSQLLTRLGDDQQGNAHSPIIGWAFDGNPIYGPYAYANGVDDSEGFQKQFTAYVLEDDRSNIIATGGSAPAAVPPSTATYPMGTFIEDYTFDPVRAAIRGGRLMAENDDFLQTENDEYINYQSEIPGVLDELNGKVCNTPEFPAELYPNGVYCYFVSTFGEDMNFPYVIGKKFKNRPVSQNLTFTDGETVIVPMNNHGAYDVTPVAENSENVVRYRNNILNSTKDEVSLSINNISTGSIKDVIVENGNPANSAVGDILFFDDQDMDGSGASAVVSKVDGKVISETVGYDITTRVMAHRQRINLNFDSINYTFFPGQTIDTETGSTASVITYDYANRYLDVFVTSPRLISFGDRFYDAKDKLITIPASESGAILSPDVVGGLSTFISYSQPESTSAQPGDLWWSSYNGRLYVYYNDGDSSQWVTAMPLGMRPYLGATDTGAGNAEASTQAFASPQADTVVSMSEQAPSSRADGTQNQRGDLWWSTHTGNLYIWSGDVIDGLNDGSEPWTSEWVVTDPAAVVSGEGVSDAHQYYTIPTSTPPEYSQSVQVLISEGSPTTMSDGTPLVAGTLWWSPLNGKMFIYYVDADTSQWVVTNPTGSLSSKWGLNTIPSGDGGSIPDYVSVLPYTPLDTVLYLESTRHFFEGDKVKFISGAPGVDSLTEEVTIVSFGEASTNFLRSDNGIELRHGTEVNNLTRSLYTVTTAEPHGLREGDEVFISGSSNSDLNGKHIVIEGGVVVPAQATVTIAGGAVTGATITDPGRSYAEDVYVQFLGGGGVGAYGIARTSGLEDGGEITSIEIINGGVNYDSEPTVVFPTHNTVNTFSIYTSETYVGGESLTYATSSENVFSTINDVEVLSGGLDYNDIPRIIGVRKREVDRASFRISLDGTTIAALGQVGIVRGGARYTNPQAFFYDITGSGSGAAATVVLDGEQVSEIIVTDGGQNYVEPFIRILETDGKFVATSDDIGEITAIDVINPGRKISADISLKPEVVIDVRLVLQSIGTTPMTFSAGQTVYQGIDTHRFVEGTVVAWDANRQILTLSGVDGRIRLNEAIYNELGAAGTVRSNGQTDIAIEVDGVSSPKGKFVTEKSQLSSIDSVIQDSEYYQYFSYVINSPLQQVQYDTFVKDIIHPTGFALFSNVALDDGVDSPFLAEDVVLGLDTPLSLTTESGLALATEDGVALVGDQEIIDAN